MSRRVSTLVAALSAGSFGLASGFGLSACSGVKDFTYDATIDAGPGDAGPCSPLAQTGCSNNTKCTITPTGAPICGLRGAGAAYSDCRSDAECAPGTACVTLNLIGFVQGQKCFPFCSVPPLPIDAGSPVDAGPLPDGGAPLDGGHTTPDSGFGYCPGNGECVFRLANPADLAFCAQRLTTDGG